MPIRVWTDSTATLGICGRQGLGKLRHIDTRSLWLQQKLRGGALELRKVRGEVNPAYLFTKCLSSKARVAELCGLFGCRFAGGRAAGAPSLRRTGADEKLLALDMVYEVVGQTIERDGHSYPMVRYEHEGEVDALPEAYVHDTRLLFPRAIAADELQEELEQDDWLEERAEIERSTDSSARGC